MHVRDNVRASRVIHALCGSPFIYIMCVRATSTTTTLMGSRRSQLMEHGRPRRSITRPRRVLWIIDAPRWTQNSNRQMFVAARAIAFGWLWRRRCTPNDIHTHYIHGQRQTLHPRANRSRAVLCVVLCGRAKFKPRSPARLVRHHIIIARRDARRPKLRHKLTAHAIDGI